MCTTCTTKTVKKNSVTSTAVMTPIKRSLSEAGHYKNTTNGKIVK